jgi:hypothetical protein
MANISITNDLIKIKKGNVLYEDEYDNSILREIKDMSIELIDSLVKLDFDWKKNDNLLVFNAVSKLIQYVGKFKKLNFDEKKNLANQVLKKIFDKILNEKKFEDNVKDIIMDGFDIVIEPSIDLALQTVNNRIELKNKCLKLCKK